MVRFTSQLWCVVVCLIAVGQTSCNLPGDTPKASAESSPQPPQASTPNKTSGPPPATPNAAPPLYPDEGQTQVQQVHHQQEPLKQTSEILLPAKGNKVAWGDVLQGVAHAGKWDEQALERILPKGEFDLMRPSSRFTVTGINLVLAPEVQLQIVLANNQRPEPALLIVFDHVAIQQTTRAVRKKIREVAKEQNPNSDRFGLDLPEGWANADPGKPLVVLLHGYNSAPGPIEGLAKALQQKQYPSGTFAYPNDQPIVESAYRLSTDLKQIAAEHPGRRVVVMTHSMGGLVARSAIEDPRFYPPNVDRLIMIAPPSHGSMLAHFGYGIDILEHFMGEAKNPEASRFYATVEDGLGEATDDLKPGSLFLRELNARERNPRVQYTIFLGTTALMSREQITLLRYQIDALKEKSDIVKFFGGRLSEYLADLEEAMHGLGDGVVAVKRGRLAGVPDTILFEFTHLGVIGETPDSVHAQMLEMIMARLESKQPLSP